MVLLHMVILFMSLIFSAIIGHIFHLCLYLHLYHFSAIIGGSVVLLLCAILLVMFIVYRMKKKDEGSYALDEPKKMPNYSYQRAPDKEFYA